MSLNDEINQIITAGGGPKDVQRYLDMKGVKYKVSDNVKPSGEAIKMGISSQGLLGQLVSKIPGIEKTPEHVITGAEIAGGFTPASPAIMGAGETLRGSLQGKSLPESLKSGAIAAGTDAALTFTGGKILKKVGAFGTLLAKGKIPEKAIATAIENPQILGPGQKAVLETTDDIFRARKALKEGIETAYESGMNSIKIPNAVVNTRNVKAAITKAGDSPDVLASIIKSQQLTKLKGIPDNAVDRLVGTAQGKLSFEEAKTLNSVLSNLLKDKELNQVTHSLGYLKNRLTKAIELSVPGTKAVNKEYAIGKTLLKNIDSLNLVDNFGEQTKTGESALKRIGEELIGKSKSKTVPIKWLEDLQARTGADVVGEIKRAAAKEAIEKGGPSTILQALGLVAGGTAGAFGLGPFGGGFGALVGAGAANTVGRPGVAKFAINQGPGLQKALGLAASPLRTELSRMSVGNGYLNQ